MYVPLNNAAKVLDWARTLLTALTQRDAELERRLAAIEARLTAGGL